MLKSIHLKRGLSLLCASLLTCAIAGCQTPDNANNHTTESSPAGSESAPDSTQTTTSFKATYTVDTNPASRDEGDAISDILYGLFLEDINFAVDAGLYAELVKNRSFEYGKEASNGTRHGWSKSDAGVLTFTVLNGAESGNCLNLANPNYAILENAANYYAGIGNSGYLDGLAVNASEEYKVSLFLRNVKAEELAATNGSVNNTSDSVTAYTGDVKISLRDNKGTVYAENTITGITDDWHKYETTLVPNATVNKRLFLYVEIGKGAVCMDMVSMMPKDTYAGLPIRKDIGEALEALNPSFLRFPGGCVIEGRSIETMYSWKNSIGNAMEFVINGEVTTGDVAVRPQGEDIWKGNSSNPYYTTYGIGFYEYFLLCEALDALAVPVLNAGMTCQVQSPKYIVYSRDSEEFKQCVQDALDLVEFCRGDETTRWGAVRIAMGHPEPFKLKYVGIGNEQWQTEYHQHYKEFVKAFQQAAVGNPDLYGDIELIVANGTASGSTEGWTYLRGNPDNITTLVDEHYYQTPEWYFKNTKRYDSYDRNRQAQVFLGEYAAKSNTLRAALAEAAYMTGIERNADVVKMACYAPLFGNSTMNQWTPDMMFFSNDDLMLTANYYVQQLYANNVGTEILPSALEVETFENTANALSGGVGLGSWMTAVTYDNLKVVSNATGDVLYETDFGSDDTLTADSWTKHKGNWSVKDGQLIQTNTGSPSDANTGDAIYVGDSSWTDYTMTVDAVITSGAEGFLIPVCVKDKDNNIFWNIGGWGNTVSCLQIVENDAKSDQVTGTVKNLKLQHGTTYQLKVVVSGDNIKCYINDKLYVNYTQELPSSLYETASVDANGDIIIKLVNPTGLEAEMSVVLKDVDMAQYDTNAKVITLAGEALTDANKFDNRDVVVPVESSVTVGERFEYQLPKYSVNIIRIKKCSQ